MRQNRSVTILKKRVVKQEIGGIKINSEIVAIPNRYKDILNNLIDNPDEESPNWPGPIDKRSRNALRFRSNLTGLSKKDYLDKNVLDKVIMVGAQD